MCSKPLRNLIACPRTGGNHLCPSQVMIQEEVVPDTLRKLLNGCCSRLYNDGIRANQVAPEDSLTCVVIF